MTTKKVQPWRRLVEILEGAVILGLPFLRIKGQSALRFDVTYLRLHFFGITLWMDEFFIVLAALIFLALLFVFVTLMFGRIWCGWICPQTVLIDYTGFFDKAKKKGLLYGAVSYGAVLIISVIVSASLIWYFVSPYEFIGRLLSQRLGSVLWGFWIVLSGVFFLNYAFLRHKWCATVCPYAKLQSVMFDNKTMVIAFDPARKLECMNCMACVRECPVGIDIRGGPHPACINCAACIDECTGVMGPKNRKGLIGYFWGLPGEMTKRTLRTNALMIGFFTATSLVFLIYVAVTRTTLGVTVLPNYNSPARVVNEKVVNPFLLSIENRGRTDEVLEISVRGLNDSKIIPNSIVMKAGEERKITVYVIAANAPTQTRTRSIEIIIDSEETGKKSAAKANFIFPEVK